MKRKTQEEKTNEYIETMRDFVVGDLKDDRDMHSLAGSINVSSKSLGEWMKKNNLKDLYGNPE